MERKSEKDREYTYHDIPAVGDEVPDLGDPELLDLGRKGQIVTQVGHLQVKNNKTMFFMPNYPSSQTEIYVYVYVFCWLLRWIFQIFPILKKN